MKKASFLIPGFLIAAMFLAFLVPEDEQIKKILQQIEKYRQKYPQEKVHLHFDKPYYTIGDTIWFKAYTVNTEQNQLSDISNILYVDLLDPLDSVHHSIRVMLNKGLAWGDFSLPDSLEEGNYRVRAYTTWMKNFGDEYFFDKTISVGKSFSDKIVTHTKYKFKKEGGKELIAAEIRYNSLDGEPLAAKEVSYIVEIAGDRQAKGKAKTDRNGTVILNFANPHTGKDYDGRIHTTIHIDDRISSSKTIPLKTTSNETDVQFLPESGRLISGLVSRVAFKALASDGLGIKVSGYVSDQNGKRITEFSSEHAGMGYFKIRPKLEDRYTAHVLFADGSEKAYPLPPTNPAGYVLTAENTIDDEQLILRIQTTEPPESEKTFTLIAQSNGVVHYIAKNSLSKGTFTASLPKSRFPTGILQLTLFSDANRPLAERLVFINHNDFLNLSLSNMKGTYSTREKVDLLLNAKNKKGEPTVGTFSVAITHESSLPYDDNKETTILSNLLLSSDLKGYVENPNYYFLESADAAKHLDLLMMTQGWSRFEWADILKDIYPRLLFQPETDLRISGKITSLVGKPIARAGVTLLSTSGTILILDTITNDKGEFVFDNLYFTDCTHFIVQARNEKDRKNVTIRIDQIHNQPVASNKNSPSIEVDVNAALLPYLKNYENNYTEMLKAGTIRRNVVLDEVKVMARPPRVKMSSNLNGPGNANTIITADQLKQCADVAKCILWNASGIVIDDEGRVFNRKASTYNNGLMHVVLDGMHIGPDFLSSINPLDIETIEVLQSENLIGIYGPIGARGVLVITTKRANGIYNPYARGIVTYNPPGIYPARQFYSPKYEGNPTGKPTDFRSTILWQPNLVTNASGEAKLQFYNSDAPGNYKIAIEGMTIDGTLTRKVFRYTVQ